MSPCFCFMRFKNLEASLPNSSAWPNHGISPLSRGGSLLDLTNEITNKKVTLFVVWYKNSKSCIFLPLLYLSSYPLCWLCKRLCLHRGSERNRISIPVSEAESDEVEFRLKRLVNLFHPVSFWLGHDYSKTLGHWNMSPPASISVHTQYSLTIGQAF